MPHKIYYVYVLFRPWNGSPFYIGKGKGDRWRDHERDGGRFNRHLANVIRKAKRLGAEIPKVKIRAGLTEQEAFQTEVTFIAAIGRQSHGGPLVNLTDGGDGPSGAVGPWRGKKFARQHRAKIGDANRRAYREGRRVPVAQGADGRFVRKSGR